MFFKKKQFYTAVVENTNTCRTVLIISPLIDLPLKTNTLEILTIQMNL